MHWKRKWQPTPVFLPGELRDGGAGWAAIYGVTQSRTRLKWLSSSSSPTLKMQKATTEHILYSSVCCSLAYISHTLSPAAQNISPSLNLNSLVTHLWHLSHLELGGFSSPRPSPLLSGDPSGCLSQLNPTWHGTHWPHGLSSLTFLPEPSSRLYRLRGQRERRSESSVAALRSQDPSTFGIRFSCLENFSPCTRRPGMYFPTSLAARAQICDPGSTHHLHPCQISVKKRRPGRVIVWQWQEVSSQRQQGWGPGQRVPAWDSGSSLKPKSNCKGHRELCSRECA